MKYGVREICNIVFKAKNTMKLGSLTFEKDEPVIYFDSAKTSTIEGSSTAVYAQGGRGNPKLVTWEGEKSLTFTFEDALISEKGMAILMGANLAEAKTYQHHVLLKVIAAKNEEQKVALDLTEAIEENYGVGKKLSPVNSKKGVSLYVYKTDALGIEFGEKVSDAALNENVITSEVGGLTEGDYYWVDGYVEIKGQGLTIEANKFSDAFYIEAETLFRRSQDNMDRAAQIVFPKGKVSSSFTLSMANTGDPSTFTFTIDAMEDIVKGQTKKALCAINIVE